MCEVPLGGAVRLDGSGAGHDDAVPAERVRVGDGSSMDLLDCGSELVLVAVLRLEDREVVELQLVAGGSSAVVRIVVEGMLGRSDEDQVPPLAFLGRFRHSDESAE